MRKLTSLIIPGLLFLATSLPAQIAPDDVAGARRLLEQRRITDPVIADDVPGVLMRQHRYQEAGRALSEQLRIAPPSPKLLDTKVRLLIQAWRLDEARRAATGLPNAHALIARIDLLEKKYDAALASAKLSQQQDPRNAEGHLVEAEVHFWNERPDLAEAPLRRALELDPLNADARFAYGYAIWRRVDARQLPAMAAQWNLALEIDPLHYVTHWHFGNGHTHLTYADYAQPTDSIVRRRLRGVDSLVADGKLADAISQTRALQAEFPQSLLPTLARGSVFYMSHDMPRAARLDSAQAAFVSLLQRKPNYGPAHNALAAVIKQRQFTYHAKFDSLEAEIARQPVPTDSAFYRVFKNIRYYPGDRVIKMAVHQLGPAMAYVPFLAKMGYTYTIPPLHQDLSEAMNTSFYRTSTTFDNRQWMDIRGSGGNHAAASIEYVERGSHQERVVLLHEYVHQFHGAVLTDAQVRRIRQLYHDAVANRRTLDYYASNNESEFFAQSYEAYVSPVKVHPLTHKAMVTRSDLIAKDPELYAFLDTLITENRAYLRGDANAMKQNWAQVYVTLAQRARMAAARSQDSLRWKRPEALLDTALMHDRSYEPALIERAAVLQAQQKWSDAANVIALAAQGHSSVAVLVAEADLSAARGDHVSEQIALLTRALERETDLSHRASLNRRLRELYYEHAMYREAIAVARAYAKEPAPSTYLRDRQDDATAFIARIEEEIGENVLATLDQLVTRKPQNFAYRNQLTWAEFGEGDENAARKLLAETERLLRGAGQIPVTYKVLRAFITDAPENAVFITDVIATKGAALSPDEHARMANLLISQGRLREAEALLPGDADRVSPRLRAEALYLRARVKEAEKNFELAKQLYFNSLKANPYHIGSRIALVRALRKAGERRQAQQIGITEAQELGLGRLYWEAIK